MIRTALALFVLLFGTMMAVAEGRFAVIAATEAGDALAPGTELSASDSIKLPEGAVVTLIAEDGQIIRLEGPYEGTIDASAKTMTTGKADDWSPIMALVAEGNDESSVLGAARGLDSASGVPGQPNVWQLSVDSSGPRCTRADGIELWRRKAGREVKVAVRSEDDRRRGLEWKANEHGLKLPSDFSVTEGLLLVSFGADLRELTIHIAPDSLTDAPPGAVLSWLIDKGCKRQALALIDTLHSGEGAR
ncbi:MAG: hypothetical protein KDJ16_10425 [Hyphomicrobiales bacterium]|nr:hypothetical protein [Hyphomicrobiales bacterium]